MGKFLHIIKRLVTFFYRIANFSIFFRQHWFSFLHCYPFVIRCLTSWVSQTASSVAQILEKRRGAKTSQLLELKKKILNYYFTYFSIFQWFLFSVRVRERSAKQMAQKNRYWRRGAETRPNFGIQKKMISDVLFSSILQFFSRSWSLPGSGTTQPDSWRRGIDIGGKGLQLLQLLGFVKRDFCNIIFIDLSNF